MAQRQAKEEKAMDRSLCPTPLSVRSKTPSSAEEQDGSLDDSGPAERDSSSSNSHLATLASQAMYSSLFQPPPLRAERSVRWNLPPSPKIEPEDEMERLRQIFKGDDVEPINKHPAVYPLASSLEARQESFPSVPRAHTIDKSERLRQNNFAHLKGIQPDKASRKTVDTGCLKEKEHVVKKISILESERAMWTSYIVNYAKGKFDLSDPLDPINQGLKLSDEMPYFPPPTPLNQFERICALRRLGPLPLHMEPYGLRSFAEQIEVPYITVSIIDRFGEVFVASTLGVKHGIPRQTSFACHAILGKGIMEVCDLTRDWRFKNHPFVTGPPKFRYFASVPIMASMDMMGSSDTEVSEFAVGTCSIHAYKPRNPLSTAKRLKLQHFASTILPQMQVPTPNSLTYTEADNGPEQVFEESGTPEEYHEDLREEEGPLTIHVSDSITYEIESRVSSVIYLPESTPPQTPTTRVFGIPHIKGIEISPYLTPGNASPEIRFLAHEIALRLGWSLLYLMRITPILIHDPSSNLLRPSNYTVDIMAAFGLEKVTASHPFIPHPYLPIHALRTPLGITYNGSYSQIDVHDIVNAYIGVLAPVKREHWTPGLDLASRMQRRRAKVDTCLGGVVIAAYELGLPTPEYMQRRDEVAEMVKLKEAGELMLRMLGEFRPGTDYDPKDFMASLEKKDAYFKGFELVGDDDFLF